MKDKNKVYVVQEIPELGKVALNLTLWVHQNTVNQSLLDERSQ